MLITSMEAFRCTCVFSKFKKITKNQKSINFKLCVFYLKQISKIKTKKIFILSKNIIIVYCVFLSISNVNESQLLNLFHLSISNYINIPIDPLLNVLILIKS